MGEPEPDRIGKPYRDRLEKVRDIQRRAIENVHRPPNPRSCRFCAHYVKKDSESGYCILWKRDVKATDTCHRFSRVDHED